MPLIKCEDCRNGMNLLNDCRMAGPGYSCYMGELRDDIPDKKWADGKPNHKVNNELLGNVLGKNLGSAFMPR
jgi:hypothetical protein